jgi:ABC-type branched-subunit amino acid transport system substrate-binding protein
MRGSRWRLASTLIVGVLTAAACGTTVPASQLSGTQAGGSGLTDGVTSGDPTGGSLGPTTSQGPGTGQLVGPTAGGSVAPTGAPSVGAQPGTTAPVVTSGVTGPGVTATTITIGALTANGAGEFQKSLGFNGATGDQIAMTRSVVDWLNIRGGIAGRKIKLVVYDLPVTSDMATAFQAACSAFTQDNKVFAVASILSDLPASFYECLRKAGVVITTTNAIVSARFYQRFAGTMFGPSAPSYTRILADSVDALWASGWLTKSSKVGVVGYDTTDARVTITDGLIPALRRHGLQLAQDVYTSTGTGAASEYSGAVLKFRAAGVDRVFFAPGGQPIYVALQADSQGYHPLLSMSTLEFPAAVAANLPKRMLVGSAGIGWSPDLDLDNASAAKVATPGRPTCIDAVRRADQDLATGTTMAIATWVCDDWFLLRDALARTPVINRASFRTAVEGLGRSFRSAATFQTYFASNRTSDAAAAYRLNTFDEGCGCYRYTSTTRYLP